MGAGADLRAVRSAIQCGEVSPKAGEGYENLFQ